MEQKDPKRLQELMSSLNAYSAYKVSPTARWKIADEVQTVNGETHVIAERVAYVAPMLAQQYKNNVALRGGRYNAMPSELFGKIAAFLTDRNAKPCLLLNGVPGTGKTTLANAIMDVIAVLYKNDITTNKMTCHRCKASELGEVVKEDKTKFQRIKTATVLYIDDIAFSGESEVVNDYGTRRRPFDDIIEYRYDRQLMTICTSNLTFEQFREKYGERIFSRMCELFAVYQCGKTDYRK